MKKNDIISNIIFWLTLISPILSFALASIVGEVDIFGYAGIIRYSWIMLFFIPLGLISILIGRKLKQNEQNYKKNYYIAFICLPLLTIIGSYRFLFSRVSYDVGKVDIIENKTKIDLPNKVKIATNIYDFYEISYVKIIDKNERNTFEQNIKNNIFWNDHLSSKIKSLLPINVQYETTNCDYFVFYNLTNDEYNMYPADGEYECVFIAYDFEICKMIIIDNLKINID